MTAAREKQQADDRAAPFEPVNRVDGIPDRSPRPALWKYVVLAVIFLGWLAFLMYAAMAAPVAH